MIAAIAIEVRGRDVERDFKLKEHPILNINRLEYLKSNYPYYFLSISNLLIYPFLLSMGISPSIYINYKLTPIILQYLIKLQLSKAIDISSYVRRFEDIKLYEELTTNGKFYEFFMKKMDKTDGNRTGFKKYLFQGMFFSNESKTRIYKIWKVFNVEMPLVSKIIQYYKLEDHSQLAIKLQKAEAEIIINKVVKRIATERPNIFVTTIHDSILTTVENSEYIKNIILEEFLAKYNLMPSIKIEQY